MTGARTKEAVAAKAAAVRTRAFSLELTKGCNLRCGYCYYAQREEAYSPASSMSRETAEEAVLKLLRDGPPDEPAHLHFFGGEPLLDLPLLAHVAEFGTRNAAVLGRELTFEVTTNGTRFTDEAIAILNRHRMQVGVSLDGPAAIQDVSRPLAGGGGSFAVIVPGLRRFLASRAGTELEDRTHASVVVTRRSLDLLGIVRTMESLGFVKVILTPATSLAGVEDGLRPEDLPQVFLALDELAEDHEQRLLSGRPVLDTLYGEFIEAIRSGAKKSSFCGGGMDYLGVAADGQVYLCYRFFEDQDHAMGSVQGGIDRALTERLLADPVDERTACGRCWARHFCGGGCHHDNLLATGKLGDPNPVTCEMLRHGMDRALGIWAKVSRDRPGWREQTDRVKIGPMADAIPFSQDDRPRTRSTCHVRDVKDASGRTERVVYEPEVHEIVVLNRTAAFVFDLCDGSRTVREIAQSMADRFRAPLETVSADLVETLDHFRRKGLLETNAPGTRG